VALGRNDGVISGTWHALRVYKLVGAIRSSVGNGLFVETNGRSAQVFKSPARPLAQFTLSPDAHWFGYGTSVRESVELMILENFH
jgi:hypothetical protein